MDGNPVLFEGVEDGRMRGVSRHFYITVTFLSKLEFRMESKGIVCGAALIYGSNSVKLSDDLADELVARSPTTNLGT
jgi:hypothetical protein